MKKTWDEEIEEFEKSMTQGFSIPGYDWDKDPFFVKKLEDAKEFLRKHPHPSMLRAKENKLD